MKDKIKIGISILVVLILVCLVLITGVVLLSNSLFSDKINKKTTNYISFDYTNDNHVIEIMNPKIIDDSSGKELRGNNYYDFEVLVSKALVKNENLKYEIIASPIGTIIDHKYIKLYLTSQSDKAMSGYRDVVPTFSEFMDYDGGKIIYTGVVDSTTEKKFRLRIWISDEFDGKKTQVLAFRLQVRVK